VNPAAIGREWSVSDRNVIFAGDSGGLWSPKKVIVRIRATENTATAIPERYPDELLDPALASASNGASAALVGASGKAKNPSGL
jgi:hypothetical protein